MGPNTISRKDIHSEQSKISRSDSKDKLMTMASRSLDLRSDDDSLALLSDLTDLFDRSEDFLNSANPYLDTWIIQHQKEAKIAARKRVFVVSSDGMLFDGTALLSMSSVLAGVVGIPFDN